MDLTKDFLHQDLHTAREEALCIINCLYLLQDALHQSDYKQSRRMAENIARSLRELERLQEKKLAEEQIKTLCIKYKIEIIQKGIL